MAPPFTRLLTPIYSQRFGISLFDALVPPSPRDPSAAHLEDSSIAAVAAALSRCHRLAVVFGVPQSHIIVFATEAMRRAINAGELARAVSEATRGLSVLVLDPLVETLIGAVMGSRSCLVDLDGGALVLDLGGGSVQMTWVDTRMENYEIDAAVTGISLPYGAAKLTRLREEEGDDVLVSKIPTMACAFEAHLKTLCATFPVLHNIMAAHKAGDSSALVDVYLCGGGFRGYGSLLMHCDPIQPYPIPSIGTYTVEGARFTQTRSMRELNANTGGKILGMSKRRRRQLPAIAAVVEALTVALPNVRRAFFCSGSNREGALMMKLPREIRESDPLESLSSIKETERPMFDLLLRILREALPREVEFSSIPTIFNTGLARLFMKEAWSRFGFDADVNTTFALHHAVTRDSTCPGLTHLARSVFALTLSARWGGELGSADAKLYDGLCEILKARNPEGIFWANYVGGVTAILAMVFPSPALDAEHVNRSIRFVFQVNLSSKLK